jgi:DNA-binding IclR family transcriptional regulator
MARIPNNNAGETAIYLRKSSTNRSLERGLEILRAFRPGISLIGNGELAERTGLPKSTVSRLTQTLVASGFLQYDFNANAYRLGVPLLSLGYAMRQGSEVLKIALPLMRDAAEGQRINVGLAVADGNEMVYLESVRRNQTEMFRHVVSGSRVPIELTSLGRAYLSTISATERKAILQHCRTRNASGWKDILSEVTEAIEHIGQRGYCAACWQGGITSIAAPLQLINHPAYVFNISLSTKSLTDDVVLEKLVRTLKKLLQDVRAAMTIASDPLQN